jgi:hypothetical protein
MAGAFDLAHECNNTSNTPYFKSYFIRIFFFYVAQYDRLFLDEVSYQKSVSIYFILINHLIINECNSLEGYISIWKFQALERGCNYQQNIIK